MAEGIVAWPRLQQTKHVSYNSGSGPLVGRCFQGVLPLDAQRSRGSLLGAFPPQMRDKQRLIR